MKVNKTKPASLHEQLLILNKQVKAIQPVLKEKVKKPPRRVLEDLTNLESLLAQVARQMQVFEDDYRNLQELAGIGQVVNSSLELDSVLRIVMDTIVRLTHAERGFLMLRDEQSEMVVRVARNWEQESINPGEAAISRTVIKKVIESGEPILTTNAQEDPRFGAQESIIAFNLRSILCVPLKVKSDLIGVIYADNRIRTGIFSESERDLLDAFSNQAAVAIENARLFSSLKQTLDEVTKLKNLMDNIFASIASGVITADVQNQITLCNRAAESILGHAASEVVGHPLQEILPTVTESLGEHLKSVQTTNTPVVGLEVSHNMPERGTVDWRFNLSALKDAEEATQGIAIVLDDMTEHKKLEAQRRLLERMVSPAVLDQIDPNSLQIGGKRMDITIIFADIRGFTTYSEKYDPEALVAVLNRYLAAMADAVLAEAGTIDKFLGDAIMAWFNAPLPQPDHTLHAVKCALGMKESFEKLYKELPLQEHLAFGAGIHYGDAVLGWIGTERRLEYTAISDSVNTAKRLQENSEKNQIIISEDAYARIKDKIEVRALVPIQVKGKSQALKVYEVLGIK
jgi:adenylate cyclase